MSFDEQCSCTRSWTGGCDCSCPLHCEDCVQEYDSWIDERLHQYMLDEMTLEDELADCTCCNGSIQCRKTRLTCEFCDVNLSLQGGFRGKGLCNSCNRDQYTD